MHCPSWWARCSRSSSSTAGCRGQSRQLAPYALLAVFLMPVLARRNDTYRPSLVIVAGTGLTLVP